MTQFLLVWLGQLVSTIGSGLTGFALGIWVYRSTGSVMQFSLIYFFTELPGIVITPLAGVIADRYDRRQIMIMSNLGGCLSTLAIVGLLVSGWLNLWHIYGILIFSSISKGFQKTAYYAATSLLIPKQQFGRASGMIQVSQASGQLFSPILAGLLVTIIQIQGVLLIDVISFILAFFTLLISRFPKANALTREKTFSALLKEIKYGWTYIAKRPGLLMMIIFFAVINFNIGLAQVLVTPMVLNFANAQVLGTILSIGGAGWLLGSLIMSLWGGCDRKMNLILGFELILGLGILGMGLSHNPIGIAIANFISFFSLPLILASSQAIWQSKIPANAQGRVLAIRSMAAWAPFPLAYLTAGPLVDKVFEPLLKPNGLLHDSVGKLIGVGPGRGIGLLLIVAGVIIVLATVIAFYCPHLRWVEDELPDAISSEPSIST
jgi:MFS transporter, DHA3 family, macrolide efflux protein